MRIRYHLPGNDDSPTRPTRGDLLTGSVMWLLTTPAVLWLYVGRDAQRVLGSISTSTLAMALPPSRICFDPWPISSSQVKASKRVRVALVMCFLSLSGWVHAVQLPPSAARERKVRLGVKK
ncbi:hypothetical protein FOIG_12977 [Fusarium odoratissimum NRRL 54006]|uniref:Uncharacterized protein n=3 Tax=Fusarium oxysporum species complex TaxID=171631 RepID=X0KAP0_FUSO5|nr:uncharacterized protein FOIG_12977 [Fusarium odoratissimum NRRL 54006]EXL94049.1 hypothetical protein FOIG_12977 [Fusarium odoratissimum NRRL 54006]TXC06742.1 hypothetical protein FocTR4_00010340 [Fusarium oxysporum f. sp. cubense]